MSAHLRAAWGKRVTASSDRIARGLTISEYDESFAKKVESGAVTATDFVRYLDAGHGVGIWWGVMGEYGDLVDFEAHAYGSGDPDLMLKGMIEEGRVGEDFIAGEINVVLIAQRPTRNGEPWDPEVHNPDSGLMGNSYLEAGERIDLIEVRYDAGWGWKALPARGIHTTAAMEPYLKQPRKDGEILLWRGISEWGGELDFFGNPYTAQSALDEIMDEWGGYGSWWGTEQEARFYGQIEHRGWSDTPALGIVVAAWWPESILGDPEEPGLFGAGHEGVLVPSGSKGRIETIEVYVGSGKWKKLPSSGMQVTATISFRTLCSSCIADLSSSERTIRSYDVPFMDNCSECGVHTLCWRAGVIERGD